MAAHNSRSLCSKWWHFVQWFKDVLLQIRTTVSAIAYELVTFESMVIFDCCKWERGHIERSRSPSSFILSRSAAPNASIYELRFYAFLGQRCYSSKSLLACVDSHLLHSASNTEPTSPTGAPGGPASSVSTWSISAVNFVTGEHMWNCNLAIDPIWNASLWLRNVE